MTQTALAAMMLTVTNDPSLSRLSARELALLALLRAEPDALWGTREVTGRLGISKPSVTRSVMQLEKMGLAVNGRAEADARLRDIGLTDAGAAAVDKIVLAASPPALQIAA